MTTTTKPIDTEMHIIITGPTPHHFEEIVNVLQLSLSTGGAKIAPVEKITMEYIPRLDPDSIDKAPEKRVTIRQGWWVEPR